MKIDDEDDKLSFVESELIVSEILLATVRKCTTTEEENDDSAEHKEEEKVWKMSLRTII